MNLCALIMSFGLTCAAHNRYNQQIHLWGSVKIISVTVPLSLSLLSPTPDTSSVFQDFAAFENAVEAEELEKFLKL